MNVSGWMTVEVDNCYLPSLRTLDIDDYPFYHYELENKTHDLSFNELGVLHDCFIRNGLYEQMSINMGDKTRFLYSFNGKGSDLSNLNHIYRFIKNSPISLNGIFCNDAEESKYLHRSYIALNVGSGINKTDLIDVDDRYGLMPHDFSFIKHICDGLLLEEKTLLSFTNKATVKAMRHLDDLFTLTVERF